MSVERLGYDRNPPALITSLLPRGRTIKNFFYYYDGSITEEAHEIYKILLNKFSENNVQVVLGHMDDRMVRIGEQVDKENFVAVKFPYLWEVATQ